MSAMQPYRFTIRGVDPELVRQMRILAIRLDMSQAQLVNAGLRAVLAHNGLAAVVEFPTGEEYHDDEPRLGQEAAEP